MVQLSVGLQEAITVITKSKFWCEWPSLTYRCYLSAAMSWRSPPPISPFPHSSSLHVVSLSQLTIDPLVKQVSASHTPFPISFLQ